jgi:pimeloyl-[acyl-carrier protein] methyl ester esterase
MNDKLHIESIGQGIPVVFIHGWGLNSGVWQPLIEKFTQNYEIITVDLPGFGLNKSVQLTDYSIENIATLIVNAVGKPAVYVGWSLGGLVASTIALNFSMQSLGLVTVASSPYFVAQDNWPGINAMVLKSFHQQLAANSQQTIENFLKIQAMGSPHIRDDIKQIQQLIMQYPQPTADTLTQSLSLLETVDLREQLANISLPVLRLYGRLDSLVPKTVPDLVSAILPKSDQYIFSKASHAPFISHLDEFHEVLNSWLAQQEKQ